MITTAKHFDIRELIPRHVFEDRGAGAWQLLDRNLLVTLDQLRDVYGPMVVNNWHFQNRPIWTPDLREWSGLRTEQSPVGTQYSQHRFGRAADCVFRDITAEEVREDILKYPDKFPLINSIELGTSWFHFDVRNCNRIMTYFP